jgi:type II secretory pathway predicted ATPase ExeA
MGAFNNRRINNMMEDHFGFKTTPFSREFPIEKRYEFPHLEEQSAALRKVVDKRMSACLIAPAGTGKSVILRSLRSSLPEARYRVSYIKVTDLSNRDLCREIATACGARQSGNYPSLVRSLQDKFSERAETEGLRCCVLIDDAHEMRSGGLAMLRLLTNFDIDSKLVVSVIIAGQPPLKERLYREGLEDIRRRLVHCGELRLLSRDESVAYIHRVLSAGLSKFPFDTAATEAIYEMSRGNMRAIDTLALKALEKASDSKTATVGQQNVVSARAEVWL